MSSVVAAEPFSPAAGRRPEKAEAILDAASQLFREHGYGAVSMDQIAREAGVSKATVYAHFVSKDQLFAAMIHNACRVYAEGLVPALTEMEDALCRESDDSRRLHSLLQPSGWPPSS